MRQTVIVGIPPNYAAILARFPEAKNRGVIFSYGERIFNPHAVNIPSELMQHEAMHGVRQMDRGVDDWWNKYLEDQMFRLDEEIYAHHAEWRHALKKKGPGAMKNIARRLSGPLYGGLIDYDQAVHAIMTGVVK